MLKRLPFLLIATFLFSSLFAQETPVNIEASVMDTFDFDLKNFKGEGAYTFITKKSKATDLAYQLSLLTGQWNYYDNNKTLRINGDYKVKYEQSFRTGKWEYFDADGELLMAETILPKKIETEYFKPFALKTKDGFDIIDYLNGDRLEKIHLKKRKEFPNAPTTYSLDYTNDSISGARYDTLQAMDSRNQSSWLLEGNSRPIKDALNLVENGSFEKNDGALYGAGQTIDNHISNWIASAGTPDYFISKHFNSQHGDAAVGCRFYTQNGNHIEFITTELKQTLESDKMYCIRLFVRLKEDCFFGVNALGAHFSSAIPEPNNLVEGKTKASVKHNGGSVLSYKTKWMQLQGIYTAIGNEFYLTLGSFANAETMTKTRLKGTQKEAYYYFDNVQVFEISDSSECPCTMGKSDLPPVVAKPDLPKKSFVIKNIFFPNDAWDLLPESFVALDSLFGMLESKPSAKLLISGHTSNTGSRERNLLLSKNRAEAVKEYLVNKGFNPELITCIGYGSDKPVADNSTEEGRSENRRVEFEITE